MSTPKRPTEPVRGVGSNQHGDKPVTTTSSTAASTAAGKAVGAAADNDPFGTDPWAEHPDHPMSDWRYEVANGDTTSGYQDWVDAKTDAETFDPDEVRDADEGDYTHAAEDAVRFGGLETCREGELYWNTGSQSAPVEGVWFDADALPSQVETDYLPEDLAAEVKHLASDEDRDMYFRSSGGRNIDHEYISVGLDEDEERAVIAHLEAQDEGMGDFVHYWASGKPAVMDRTYGLSNPKEVWGEVSAAVRDAAPKAAKALDVAERLYAETTTAWKSQTEYIGTDDWKREEWEAENA